VPHHWWIVPLIAVTLTQIAAIVTSVYLHRGLAHRALRLHPVTEAGCRALLWLTTGQSRREWVAVHRKHHTFTDREGDPHSPQGWFLAYPGLERLLLHARSAQPRDDPNVCAGHRRGLAGS
jgi:fatty-acid desaturase